MGASHLEGPLYVGGVPVGGYGIPATPWGRVYYVDSNNGDDGRDGTTPEKAKATIAAGYALLTSGNHDVLVLSGNASHTLTSELVVAKNRVHIMGWDNARRHYGQRAKVNLGVSTGTGIAAIKVTGVGCTFRNLKVTSSDTLASSVYCIADGGEFTLWEDCEFLKTTDLDQTGAAEVLHNGDSCVFRRCAIGNGIYTPSVARQHILFTRETITGKVARDVMFEDCIFMARAGATTFVNLRATANDIERLCLFRDCIFCAVKTSTSVQALVAGIASALTDSEIILKDCVVQNITNVAANTAGIFTNSPTPVANATETVAVHTS
jgi:hypothetical protein